MAPEAITWYMLFIYLLNILFIFHRPMIDSYSKGLTSFIMTTLTSSVAADAVRMKDHT